MSLTNFFKQLLFIVKVEGESCLPYLTPGRYYLASKILKPYIKSFIVFKNPKNLDQILVKQVDRIEKDGFFVKGTLSWSTSSREIGLVPPQLTLGTIIKA